MVVDTQILAQRMDAMEATVARLVTAVDGIVDKVVSRVVDAVSEASTTPIVMTKGQLEEAINAATNKAQNSDKNEPSVVPQQPQRPRPATAVSVSAPPRPATPEVTWKPSRPTQQAPVHHIDMDTNSPPATHTRAPVAVPRFVNPQPVTLPMARPPVPPPQPIAVTAVPPKKVVSPTPVQDNGRLYLWGNAWRHLPEDYEFPRESLEVMWRLWCCGDDEKGHLPLKRIQASDIASLNDRKRLSDLKFLMKYIEKELQERGVWKVNPTPLEADQMLRAASNQLPSPAANAKGQKRELQSLKWHSAVTLLRGTVNKKARCV